MTEILQPLSDNCHHTDGTARQSTAAVVGGGISGLAASIALRRAGWAVSIYERSKFKNEIGAGITVPPNATLVLKRLGFNFPAAQPVPNETIRMAMADTLDYFLVDEFPGLGQEVGFGLEGWTVHRVDLHKGLREVAVSEEGEGRSVELNLGCEVKSVDCDKGVLVLENGKSVKKDLVVLADGANSHLIQYFTGHPSGVDRTGRSIYRWLVSMDDVLAELDVAAHYDPNKPTGFICYSDPKKQILWVSYVCRGGTILNNAVVHDTQAGEGEEDFWHSPASKEQVLSMLNNFHPTPKKIVNMASEDGIKVHHLFKRPALDSFVRGKTIVIGDAAHVMMPTHAAGGAVAIESSAALEVLFHGVDGRDDETIRKRLELFDRLRLPRCNLTMLASNAGPQWLGVPGVEEEIRRFYTGPLPPAGTLPWTRPFREVLFHHDAYRAAEEALSRSLESG